MSITSIHEKITEEINNHHNSFLIVVNTVNKSVDLYKSILKKSKLKKYFQNSEDDSRENIFLLNSTMLSSRRKELINIVKQKSKTNERTLIISTQSIEAGVDLDFDIGFRELAPIDSILQTAGRINRNYRSENKPYKLYISEQSKDINQVYRDDLDLLIDKEKNKKNKKTKIEMKDVFELLTGISNNNDFIDKLNKTGDRAYTDLTNEIINKMKDNRGKKLEFTEYDYINIVNNLRYLTLDKKIDVISSNGFSFYIKGQIPIKGLKKEEVDTFKEILKEFKDLISSLDINFNKLINEEYIDSNLFLELYKSVISTKDYSKEEKKIQLKKLNSILNCCLISVNINKRYLNSKMQYDDIIDMYILPLSKNKEDGLYSYSKGIDKEQLKKLSKNTLIF
jgi:CRISPR-associated endonuclease/helicase Cas3